MILEKTKTEKELIKDLKNIMKIKMTKEEKELLEEIVYKIFANDIGREKIEGIMKKLESKEEREMVIEEVLRKSREREFKKGISEGKKLGLQKGIELGVNKGRKEEKNKIILEMIRNEVGDSIIMKIVNISEDELKEVKKKLNSKE